MKVKELIEKLKEFDENAGVVVVGCYESEGEIEELEEDIETKVIWKDGRYCRDKKYKIVRIYSDICSG